MAKYYLIDDEQEGHSVESESVIGSQQYAMTRPSNAKLTERILSMSLLKDNAELQQIVLRTYSSTEESLKKTIPAMLDAYLVQVSQVQRVLGCHLHEMLWNQTVDADKASKMIDAIARQVFKDSKPLRSIRQNLNEVAVSFKDETDGPQGLRSALEVKRNLIKRMIWIGLWSGSCKNLITWAYTMYANEIRPILARVFKESVVDSVASGCIAGLLALPLFHMAGCLFAMALGSLVPIVAAPTISRVRERPCQFYAEDHCDLSEQLKDADSLIMMCENVGWILRHAEKHTDMLALSIDAFEHRKTQLEFLLESHMDARRWSSQRLVEYLESIELGACAEAFLKHKISGNAFVDIITEADLKDTLGITDLLTLRRLLDVQKMLHKGKVQPSDQIKVLADSLLDVFKEIIDQLSKMKEFLQQF